MWLLDKKFHVCFELKIKRESFLDGYKIWTLHLIGSSFLYEVVLLALTDISITYFRGPVDYIIYSSLSVWLILEKETIFMASLSTLPVHIVYRILDQLKPVEILISVRNVCTRLKLVTDSYHPYKVSSGSLS